jgi:hypothetical protein
MGKQYVFGVFCFLLLTSAYFGPHFVLRSQKRRDIEKMVDRKIYEYSCMSAFGQKEDIQIDDIWGFSLLHIYSLGSEMVISLLLCLLLRMKQTFSEKFRGENHFHWQNHNLNFVPIKTVKFS